MRIAYIGTVINLVGKMHYRDRDGIIQKAYRNYLFCYMRKLKYYVACSVDGFIARKDGSYDCFPWDDEVIADYLESLKSFDVVLMGRKTYEYPC